jgi:hypothetical protein
MSFFGDSPAELLYAMPGIGGAVTATLSTGSGAGGPQLGGGGASSTLVQPAELPHNYFSKVGKSILIEGGGVFATAASGNGNFTLGLYLNTVLGTPSAVLLAKSGALAVIGSITGNWYFRLLVTCTATGSAGTLQSIGMLAWGPNALTATAYTEPTVYLLGASSTTPVTFNTGQSVPVWIEPLAFWSATTTTQSITMTNMFVWGLN